ncbi:MAG: hypothetical protein MI867_12455 [Pseudomonadales bacterium]|nr:hypothetical protein [Pseudomonadales bacterium]
MVMFDILYVLAWAVANRLRGHDFYNPKVHGITHKVVDVVTGKTPIAIYMFLLTWLYTQHMTASLLVAIGYRIWAIPGRGVYNTSFTGNVDAIANRKGLIDEIKIVDKWADKIFAKIMRYDIRYEVSEYYKSAKFTLAHCAFPRWESHIRYWGAIAISLRALLVALMFIPLAFIYDNWLIALVTLPCAILEGICYFAMSPYYAAFLERYAKWVRYETKKKPSDNALGYAEYLFGIVIGVFLYVVLNLMANNPTVDSNALLKIVGV